jgi:hypothetical protein
MNSNHLDSTICWYMDWLKRRNPEWTEEQRLELATGFATSQQQPQKLIEQEEEEPSASKDGELYT